jgi:Polyphosphate kinase 2 (PPK2)
VAELNLYRSAKILEHRMAALPALTERQKTQLHAQRYVDELPAGDEVVIFDRSWYNRAAVEYVMRSDSKDEHRQFLRHTWWPDPAVYVLRRKRGTNVFRPQSPEHPDDESFPGLYC